MIACAFTGPISGSASRSALLAVLMFTAAKASAENSTVTSSSTNLFMVVSPWVVTIGPGSSRTPETRERC
jgi:hypothetical protein